MHRSLVQVSGHIIDSLILSKILDCIIDLGADFEIIDITIGHRRTDPSSAHIQIEASSTELLDRVLRKIKEHGAVPQAGDRASFYHCSPRSLRQSKLAAY